VLGVCWFWQGEFRSARAHLAQALAHYDPEHPRAHIALYAQDPGVICLIHLAYVLWYLGYPDQAVKRGQEARRLAQELSHPFSLAYALTYSAWLHNDLRDRPTTQACVEASLTLATGQGQPHWVLRGRMLEGWLLVEQGKVEVGIARMHQSMAAYRETGAELGWPYYLALLAQAYGQVGEMEPGLRALAEAMETVNQHGDRWCEAELYRLRGELLLAHGAATDEVEACFRQALAIAGRQGAKSLELRAALSLSRLWQKQGRGEEGRQLLSEVYGWFTEGFDTPDLIDAKALLEELS
jgi:predicted ATPase